jgi:hypothetical protein
MLKSQANIDSKANVKVFTKEKTLTWSQNDTKNMEMHFKKNLLKEHHKRSIDSLENDIFEHENHKAPTKFVRFGEKASSFISSQADSLPS